MRKLTLAILAIATAAFAQPLPPGVEKKASAGGITEYQYPNGLRVLLYPDAATPKITVNLIVQVGSRHEGYGESGMAHLLEHLDFIETNSGRKIKDEITAHSSNWNGTTSEDRTNYYETVTATDENLRWALGLEAARLVDVKITKQILDVEMTVVRNEFERGENNPVGILSERVASTAYLWHNYGKSTIGSREDLERVPAERLAAFYRKYYQPDNAVLAVGGKIDEAKTLRMIADTFGRIPRPTRALDQTYTVEPTQDGMRYVELRRVGENPELIMVWHAPAAAHPDSAALQVLSGIMNGSGGGRGGRGGGGTGMPGRLTKALVENRKADSARFGVEQYFDPGLIDISVGLSPSQSIDEARKIVTETLKGIVSEPPTKEEVDRVKLRTARAFEQMFTDPQTVVMGMTTPVAQGDWRLLFLQQDRIQKVTPEDVVRVAKAYLKDSNLTVGVFIPEAAPDRSPVPAAPPLAATLNGYTTQLKVARAEEFDPTPANIEKRVVRSTLANGMKVAMLPIKMAGGTVSVAVELHFGDSQALAGHGAEAQLAGSLLMMGTAHHTRQQIQDEMEKLDARIQVNGGGGTTGGGRGGRGTAAPTGSVSSASATVTAKPENLPAALRLAVEILREPAFPEADFDRIKGQRVRALENVPTQPEVLSAEQLQRHLSPFTAADALYQPTREEQLAAMRKVTVDDVKKFHRQFYGASHGEFVVVGDADQAAIRKLADELLGSWTTPGAYTRLTTPYRQAGAINRKIETPDKENAQFEAGLRLAMNENDTSYPALVLVNYMFGGSITARMPNRIRNKEGLSYGASSRFAAPADGTGALFSATVSTNPVNMPKVEASFLDELKRTLKDGFTQAELDRAKVAYADARKVARAQEGALVTLIANREQFGRTLAYDAQLESGIQSLTLDQVNSAARKYLDPSAISIVKAGDFKKAGVYQ